MNAIIVEVTVPLWGECINFLLPSAMKVDDGINLMRDAICDRYGANKCEGLLLVDMEEMRVLNGDSTYMEQGVTDGARFLLI